MKIRIRQDQTATLPADRQKLIEIDGAGQLTFTRNEAAISLRPVDDVLGYRFMNLTYVGLRRRSRLGRFLRALPELWKFCK